MKQEEIKKIEKQADNQLKKVLKDLNSDELNQVYYVPTHFTKMVAEGNARGFLLYGEAGIGKTHLILKAFKEVDKPFIILSGHITGLELYHFLFEHRKENIILDDVNILDTEQNLNLLKACLNDKNRTCQYNTTSTKLRVPNKFLFEGSLIILLNTIPKEDENFRAVKSRILCYELKMNYQQKLEVIEGLSKQKYKDLKEEERKEIFLWLKENLNQATTFNLRTLFQCYEFYLYNSLEWKKLAKQTIIPNKDVQLILKGLSEWKWCEETRKHRATYYRLKNELIKPICNCGELMDFGKELCGSCQHKKWREEMEKRQLSANI